MAIAAAALVAAAGCAAGPGPGPRLVGTEWRLASYREPGGRPVAVSGEAGSTLRFDGKGHWSADGCNGVGGDAAVYLGPDGAVGSGRVRFGPGVNSTAVGCTGEPAAVDDVVVATTQGEARWTIRDGTLTLTGRDGHKLTYRVGPSIHPERNARTRDVRLASAR